MSFLYWLGLDSDVDLSKKYTIEEQQKILDKVNAYNKRESSFYVDVLDIAFQGLTCKFLMNFGLINFVGGVAAVLYYCDTLGTLQDIPVQFKNFGELVRIANWMTKEQQGRATEDPAFKAILNAIAPLPSMRKVWNTYADAKFKFFGKDRPATENQIKEMGKTCIATAAKLIA